MRMNLRQHPLSAIFPALPDDELKALAADIKAHGLRSQIVLYKGEVLDGWHRYRACEMVGVKPRTIDYNGSETLKEAVKEGVIAIDKAAEIAKLPKEKQAKAMAEPTKKKAKPAKQGDDWKAKYDALLEDYNALKENRDDLADELKTCEAIRTGAEAVEMQKLRAEVKHCTRRRDELMASAHEMRKECTRWQERAKKAGWRPNK